MSEFAIENSTNVRVVGAVLRAVAAVSPGLAAAALETLFITPRRRPAPVRERPWLAGSESWTVRAGARDVVVRCWGTGPAVLLVHGWEGRGSQLGPFVAPLSAAGFRAVAFDAPGHGDSPGRRSSLVEMAQAVGAVARDVGGVHGVIAHSLGAAAVTAAIDAGLRPERAVFLAPPADAGRFLYALAAALGLDAEIARRAQRRTERRLGVAWERVRLAGLAPSMSTPLLVFHDRGDREVPWASGAEVARRWPGSRLVTTSGLGHRRILRDPDVVAGAVGFLTAGTEEAAWEAGEPQAAAGAAR